MNKVHLLCTVLVLVLWSVICYYSEWLIFYCVLAQCTWPKLSTTSQNPVHAMIFADTHLLSRNASNWFDIVRTDWEMNTAFQMTVALHKPDIIFILGDLTDEGLFMTNSQFDYYVQHFYDIFSTPNHMDLYVISGNHDIGFHYEVTEHLNSRFVKGFHSKDVRLITVRDVHFVLINSVLFEANTTCSYCDDAKLELETVARKLRCADAGPECTSQGGLDRNYSRPILLQHFPMYRHSDTDCHEPDEAPPSHKYTKMNESIDCHSQNISNWLLREINPRLVFSGHTHDGCTTPLSNKKGVEYTISSFNWKHKNNPGYGLVVLTPNDYAFTRCLLPEQIFAILRYIFYGMLYLSGMLYYTYGRRRRRRKNKNLFYDG